MHETGLLKDMLRQISVLAKCENANRIAAITVQLGALTQISPEHFREHFDIESKGTIAEGASLVIELNNDIQDPQAQEIILKDIEIFDEILDA